MYYSQIKVRVDLSNDWRNGLFDGFDSICDADSDSMSYLHLSIELYLYLGPNFDRYEGCAWQHLRYPSDEPYLLS